MFLIKMFGRRWWWTTLLVIAAVGVMVRLGIWQLDRLEQRRAFNARVIAQAEQEPVNLNDYESKLDFETMEYRKVMVRGTFDPESQVALRNQVWNGIPGYCLLTPMKIAGTENFVLVNRGWIPADENTSGNIGLYPVEGEVEIRGVIRYSQEKPDFGGRTDPTPIPGEILAVWNLANVAQIQHQLPYPVMPVYIQRTPDSSYPEDLSSWPRTLLPFPSEPELDLSEGPHFGYAIQWFTFASILTIGYPIFIHREERETIGTEERV